MPRRDLCQVRRGAAANWASVNPVLASGEAGYETDTGQLKYGNGSTAWSDLPYFSTGSGNGGGGTLPPNITTLGNPITATEFDYLSGTTDFVQTQLNAKAPTGHAHSIDNVTGLQAALDGKMPTLYSALPTANFSAVGAQTNIFPAGATIAAGNAVKLNNAAKWILTDADATATSTGLIAMALESKNLDEIMLVALQGSFVRVNSWNWAPGSTIYLSTDPGVIAESMPNGTDDVIRVVGWAINADMIWFNPSPDYITHI